MLACGHEKVPFGLPVCVHLRTCRGPDIRYVRWYTGTGLDVELLCIPCADEREQGRPAPADVVCEECFAHATTEVGELVGVRGKPEVRTRSEPFDGELRKTALPNDVGTIVDIAHVGRDGRSSWLMLAEDGRLTRFDADTGAWAHLAVATVPAEPDHDPWMGHTLKRRLHASAGGEFAAVVHNYGRYGQIIDLRSGKVTLALDGGDYHSETVPFSFAFADVHGRVVAVHRTAWNRLDVSDPSTGVLLTEREPTSYRTGEERPEHYLDYFHGALHVSPSGARIVDDGWVWHPFGVPMAWGLEHWLSGNVWESEDGSTMKSLCGRAYYWDHAMTWLDDNRVAVGGIGDDDNVMIGGARIFDVTLSSDAGERYARELTAFPGPAGLFFGHGRWLYSSDPTGLSRWDVSDGTRTGHLPNYQPTHCHQDAGEFVQVIGNVLVRWKVIG
ncbi:MAG: hypothetical protein U0746_03400 [Gemmataceae bacterium]